MRQKIGRAMTVYVTSLLGGLPGSANWVRMPGYWPSSYGMDAVRSQAE